MTTKEILELVRAGFTHDEIVSMGMTEQTPEHKTPEPEKPAPEPEQTPEPAPSEPEEKPEPEVATSVIPQEMLDVLADMKKTLSTLQNANTRKMSQPEVPEATMEDVLMGFLGGK